MVPLTGGREGAGLLSGRAAAAPPAIGTKPSAPSGDSAAASQSAAAEPAVAHALAATHPFAAHPAVAAAVALAANAASARRGVDSPDDRATSPTASPPEASPHCGGCGSVADAVPSVAGPAAPGTWWLPVRSDGRNSVAAAHLAASAAVAAAHSAASAAVAAGAAAALLAATAALGCGTALAAAGVAQLPPHTPPRVVRHIW